MSSNLIRASFFRAMIMIIAAFTITVSAQTPGAVNNLPAKPDPIREAKDNDVEKASVLAAEVSEPNAGPKGDSAINPGSKVSFPVRGNAGTSPAAIKDEGPTVRTATTSAQASDNWEFQFSPYFWLASLHGTAGIGNRTTGVDMSFGDIFGSLKFALMGVFEARKGRFISLTDMEYVSIRDDKATPGPFFSNVDAGFKTFIFDQEVGYRLYDDSAKGASVDVLGGIRVWHVSTDLDFGAGILPAQQIQGSRNWVDGVVGLRGKTALSEKVFVTGKFDLGGGGSQFTWQLFGGLGYSITPNIALIGGYRVLDVDYDKNNFIYDMNQRGPIFGLGFKF